MLFITTEAVICMKTNKTGIICHGNQWTFSAKPSAVGPIMLLKTHVEKMSETGHAIMYMKIRHIEVALHYIDDNKYS